MTLGKRMFDLVVVAFLAVPVGLLCLGVGLWLWRRQGGPIFYISERMKTPTEGFQLVKFRTMAAAEEDRGATGPHKSARITPEGRFLRRTRLDELPQLWNVARGDMSFVGPRPPLREYVERFPELYRDVLSMRPGVTGLATLTFHRHEAWLLKRCWTPEESDAVYARNCLPRKARLDRIYAARCSLWLDMLIMWRTFYSVSGLARAPQKALRRYRPAPGLATASRHAPARAAILGADLPAGAVQSYVGKSVLVAGAGSPMGRALSQQLLRLDPRRLVLFDPDEVGLAETLQAAAQGLDPRIHTLSGAAHDGAMLRQALSLHGVEYVFNVPTAEPGMVATDHGIAALRGVALGSLVLARAALATKTERFMQISGSAVPDPETQIGAALKLAEIGVLDLAVRPSQTLFSILHLADGQAEGQAGRIARLALGASYLSYGGDIFALGQGGAEDSRSAGFGLHQTHLHNVLRVDQPIQSEMEAGGRIAALERVVAAHDADGAAALLASLGPAPPAQGWRLGA